ncbi:hypothetical protein DPMN_041339, partial [Dreissena polymorpha]
MARQRPTRLVIGPCIVEIDRIVIREVQYQLEVNRLKDNFGWVWPITWLVMGPYIVEIEVNRCRSEEIIVKGSFGWAWPMWAGRPRVGNGAMHMNRCRNEEIIVKGNFGWAWPMWAGCPRIDRIVISEVQYQFVVNRCRNAEIIVKGNFGWAWPMWAGCPRIDRIVIREVQYQFEVNRLKDNFGWAWPMWPGSPRVGNGAMHKAQYQFEVNRCRNEEVNFQGSSANSVGGPGGQDRRTDRQTHITTISPLFLRKTWGYKKKNLTSFRSRAWHPLGGPLGLMTSRCMLEVVN